MGAPNANVFPEPVALPPIISFPSIIRGIAFVWISLGSVNFAFSTREIISCDNPSFLNLSILLLLVISLLSIFVLLFIFILLCLKLQRNSVFSTLFIVKDVVFPLMVNAIDHKLEIVW